MKHIKSAIRSARPALYWTQQALILTSVNICSYWRQDPDLSADIPTAGLDYLRTGVTASTISDEDAKVLVGHYI
jgi:hypothetical protein